MTVWYARRHVIWVPHVVMDYLDSVGLAVLFDVVIRWKRVTAVME